MNTNDPTNIPDLNFPSFAADAQVAIETLKRVATAGQALPRFATGGVITPPLTVADLSAKHIGKKVRITDRGDTHTGHIEGLTFDHNRLYRMHGASAVRVEFDRATITYPLDATVTVLT